MKKNEKEKQMLYEWGVKNYSKDIFENTGDVKESYFGQRSDNSYIREYSFETLSELMKELDMLWGDNAKMETIKKVIGVAAMKNKTVKIENVEQQIKVQADPEEKLPEFIYNF